MHAELRTIKRHDYGNFGTARVCCQEQGLGPAPVGRLAADDPGAWRCASYQPAADGARDRSQDDVRHHERLAAQGLRRKPRMRLLFRHSGSGALPGQRLSAAARRRCGHADNSVQDPDPRRAQCTQDLCRPFDAAARSGAGDRSDRLGQVDHARGNGQSCERESSWTYSDR